jgi:hypothetical protein
MMTRRGFLATLAAVPAAKPVAAAARPWKLESWHKDVYNALNYGQSFTVERVAAELFHKELRLHVSRLNELEELAASVFSRPYGEPGAIAEAELDPQHPVICEDGADAT